MPSSLRYEPNAAPELAPVRRPKVDFDQNGQPSSLRELIQLGGLFPLARIQDRLPFSRYTLGAMAEAWKEETPEWLVCAQAKGRRSKVLIHLDRFTEALGAHSQAESDTSSLAPVAILPELEECTEMLVLCEKIRGLQGFSAPA